MNKKIIAIGLCVAMLSALFVACGKKTDNQKEKDENFTPEIAYTIDAEGEKYVTNVNGDLIPVTTGKDGSVELVEDLVTKTKEQVKHEKEEESKKVEASKKAEEDKTNPNAPQTDAPVETSNSAGIIIGNDDPIAGGEHDAVIQWN